jgi:coenzyme F420 hydrogenase subunit beta
MIESLCKLQKYHPVLKDRIVLTVALICAGMDSHANTRAYLQRYGVDESRVRRICFRGGGWPGRFRVFGDDDEILLDRPLLGDSLIHLVGQDNYLRCWNCVDHWGSMADISVSDPWCDEMVENETKGRSAVMVKTERAKQAVKSAIENGDLKEDRVTLDDVLGYNSHLVIDRKHYIHMWAPVYQLMFFGRIKKLGAALMQLFRGKKIGLRSILKARFNKNYYQ